MQVYVDLLSSFYRFVIIFLKCSLETGSQIQIQQYSLHVYLQFSQHVSIHANYASCSIICNIYDHCDTKSLTLSTHIYAIFMTVLKLMSNRLIYLELILYIDFSLMVTWRVYNSLISRWFFSRKKAWHIFFNKLKILIYYWK